MAISDVNDNSIIADTENKSTIQKMVAAENTYGFVHNGKIYLNPELMNSNAAVHEYTHLWDAYTQKTNPELWNKGLEIFKDTKYWNEVISDPNYQDIKDDENLVLSEIHARIQGNIAEKVLDRIAELDGEQVKQDAINWNEETWNYIRENFYDVNLIGKELSEFLLTPMRDLMTSRNITVSESSLEKYITKDLEKENNNQLNIENVKSNDVNKKSKFDLELSYFIGGKLSSNHIFNFGLPGEILKKCGFPENQKIEMIASRLQFKSNNDWHKFELEDIYGLDKALQNPVAVIEYGDRKKSQNIIVELQKDGKNFLAGIHFNQQKNGFEVSSIRTLFPKDTIEILNWIDQGKMIYGNKEKLQALINQQRINVAEVNNQVVQSPLHEHCLESVSNLIKKFGNVNQIFTDENDFNDIAHLTKEIVDEFNEKRNSIMNAKNEPVYQEKLNESASLLLNIDFQKLSNTEEQNKLTEIFKNILKIENPNLMQFRLSTY